MLVFAQSQECVPTLLFRSWLLPASDSSMYRIKRQHKALSPEVIRNALIHVQHSVFKHKRTQKSYVMPAQINPEAKKSML